MLKLEEYHQALKKFREVCPTVVENSSSRIEKVLPKLSVQRLKKTSIIVGLSTLARRTNRPQEYVRGFFIKKTACIVEKLEVNRLHIRGHISLLDVKKFENQYLRSKILCSGCKNPDTVLVSNKIECRNCNMTREEGA